MIVFMSRTVPAVKGQCDYVYFDRYTGEHLKTWSRGMSRSTGDAIVNSVVPVHFGTFGGWPVRMLWSVLGLAPAVLFASGFVMWWNRVLGPWWRRFDGFCVMAGRGRPARTWGSAPLGRTGEDC